jgi:hypothetical protein
MSVLAHRDMLPCCATLSPQGQSGRSVTRPGLRVHTLVRQQPREPEIAVARAASQRLCPFQMDAGFSALCRAHRTALPIGADGCAMISARPDR